MVRLDLFPHYAAEIPDTVTARVVPSNVFAGSARSNWWTTAQALRSRRARISPRTTVWPRCDCRHR